MKPALFNRRHFHWDHFNCGSVRNNMGKNGTQCCAFGCNKRKKRKSDATLVRSDSDGSDDEESAIKRKFPRTFHS